MPYRFATTVVSSGRPQREEGASLNPSLTFASTFYGSQNPENSRTYARASSPNWEPFEKALGQMEACEEPAVLFSSGMAAVAAAFSLLPAGAHVLMARHTYLGTIALARELEREGRLSLELFDVEPGDEALLSLLATADVGKGERVLWMESPTNPMLEVSDLPRVLKEAKSAGIFSVVDNTFATPRGQQPLSLGADVVLHSVTKYLSGHSDLILGALVTNSSSLRQRMVQHRTLHGAIAGGLDALLALRGLRTLDVRMERAQQNAAVLAWRLAQHPEVSLVRHPSLPEDPGHEVASRTMNGFGAMISFCPQGGVEAAERIVQGVRLWAPATSLGGVESTLERRRRHPDEQKSVPEQLIRLSVGIENVEDLWEDLERALG